MKISPIGAYNYKSQSLNNPKIKFGGNDIEPNNRVRTMPDCSQTSQDILKKLEKYMEYKSIALSELMSNAEKEEGRQKIAIVPYGICVLSLCVQPKQGCIE